MVRHLPATLVATIVLTEASMKFPSKHRVGRVLFNTIFIIFLSGVVSMIVLAGKMCGCGDWAGSIAAVIAIPLFAKICSDMADYAIWRPAPPHSRRPAPPWKSLSSVKRLVSNHD